MLLPALLMKLTVLNYGKCVKYSFLVYSCHACYRLSLYLGSLNLGYGTDMYYNSAEICSILYLLKSHDRFYSMNYIVAFYIYCTIIARYMYYT